MRQDKYTEYYLIGTDGHRARGSSLPTYNSIADARLEAMRMNKVEIVVVAIQRCVKTTTYENVWSAVL